MKIVQNIKITIFTPTYNRAYILSKLYDSLKKQTCKNFIWLIIDDGSTDETQSLVEQWINEGKVEIEYYRQKNQGKSMAHNKGVNLTNTDLFTCVDSDDYLKDSAVEEILTKWDEEQQSNYIGILAYKGYPNGKSLTLMKNEIIESTTLKFAYSKLGLRGDTMLIFKTNIISKYEFPRFPGEKFVPEAYLYDLLDQEGELLLLHKVLYYCEYLDDGYTKNMARLLSKNPKGYLAFIKQRLTFDVNLKDRILNTVRYTAMCLGSKEEKIIVNSIYPLITILSFPLGYIFYLKRYKGVQ